MSHKAWVQSSSLPAAALFCTAQKPAHWMMKMRAPGVLMHRRKARAKVSASLICIHAFNELRTAFKEYTKWERAHQLQMDYRRHLWQTLIHRGCVMSTWGVLEMSQRSRRPAQIMTSCLKVLHEKAREKAETKIWSCFLKWEAAQATPVITLKGSLS